MKRALIAFALVAACVTLIGAQTGTLTPYQKVSGVSGSLTSVGSDSMNNMMTLGGNVPAGLPERQDPGRRQRVRHRATCADRGHVAVRPDVPPDEAR
jgi:hypothetical protein